MYRTGREAWLAIFAGERGHYLDYRRLWAHGDPVAYTLRVWEYCHWLPPVPRTHALRKLERFMATGRLVPTG
eukprot:8476230-Lingulodinium_polyedra.AAC.1